MLECPWRCSWMRATGVGKLFWGPVSPFELITFTHTTIISVSNRKHFHEQSHMKFCINGGMKVQVTLLLHPSDSQWGVSVYKLKTHSHWFPFLPSIFCLTFPPSMQEFCHRTKSPALEFVVKTLAMHPRLALTVFLQSHKCWITDVHHHALLSSEFSCTDLQSSERCLGSVTMLPHPPANYPFFPRFPATVFGGVSMKYSHGSFNST